MTNNNNPASGYKNKTIIGAILSCLMLVPGMFIPPAQAGLISKDNIASADTVLIPISPKIDTSDNTAQHSPNDASATGNADTSSKDSTDAGETSSTRSSSDSSSSKDGSIEVVSPLPTTISAEQGSVANDAQGVAGSVLKGTIQMTADDTEYDQDNKTFLGTGNAVVLFGGENSKLEADTVLYDESDQTIDARGNVRIYRNGDLTTGSSFKFKVNSNEYLLTSPDTEFDNVTVISRFGYGDHSGITFKNGNMQLSNVLRIANNPSYGPFSSDLGDRGAHPDAFLPEVPGYKFTARKMVYERYKETGNLTVFGGKLQFGNFDMPIPLPKFTLSVSQDNSRVVFPIMPMLTNNLQMGGTSIGPAFNFTEGKNSVLTVAPLWQFGGTPLEGTRTMSQGPAVRLQYRTPHVIAHFAYGSVSNFVVADYKYFFSKSFKLQSGINRYLEDGLFGVDRARLRAELVKTKSFGNVLPGIASVAFRSAGGWYQDNPALINQSATLQQLYGVQSPFKGKIAAFRVSEQATVQTHPLFYVGDEQCGAKLMLYGGTALRAYSTGDYLLLGQMGPVLDVRLNRVRLRGGYTQSAFSGHSPFVFDQFIQGTRSVYAGGDFKLCKYLALGGTVGYNLTGKAVYQKTICAAIGPDDFKILLSRDMIHGINRYGFDILFGQTAPFNKLIVKAAPDQGQLGGI